MQIEQGIATQRIKLFRLVAGLLLALGFVSVAPFSCAFRGWVRGWVLSILTRAECATQNLVRAQAMVLAARRGLRVEPSRFFALGGGDDRVGSTEELPSLAALRARLNALQAVLADLPRYGLRLLRRVIGPRSRRVARGGARPMAVLGGRFPDLGLVATRVERPPDKVSGVLTVGVPPSRFRAGGRLRLGCCVRETEVECGA